MVTYATANGTATSGSDYTSTSGTLTFAPSETIKVVNVPILDDRWLRATRAVTVALSSPSNGTLGTPTSATVTTADARRVRRSVRSFREAAPGQRWHIAGGACWRLVRMKLPIDLASKATFVLRLPLVFTVVALLFGCSSASSPPQTGSNEGQTATAPANTANPTLPPLTSTPVVSQDAAVATALRLATTSVPGLQQSAAPPTDVQATLTTLADALDLLRQQGATTDFTLAPTAVWLVRMQGTWNHGNIAAGQPTPFPYTRYAVIIDATTGESLHTLYFR